MDTALNRISDFFLSFKGFSPEYAEEWRYLKGIKKYAKPNSLGVSHRDILSLLPFDARIDRSLLPSGVKTHQLFADRLSTRFVLSRHRDLTPEIYFSLLTRDGERFIQSYDTAQESDCGLCGILELIRKLGKVVARPSENSFSACETVLSYDGNSYYADGERLSESEMWDRLKALPDDSIICQYIEGIFDIRIAAINDGKPELLYSVMLERENNKPRNYYTDNRAGGSITPDGKVRGGRIAGFEQMVNTLLEISSEFTDLEYMSYLIRVCPGGFYIMQVDTGKDLVCLESFNEKTAEFLRRKLENKKRMVSLKQALIIFYRSLWGLRARRHGFVDFMYRNGRRALRADKRDKFTTKEEKKWAHKRGFLSFHIKQYGLTEENCKDFLSDYDYKRLRPINNRYYKWIWDKVSLRYMLDDYKEYLPEYYYNFVRRDGKVKLIKMQDIPEGYGASFEDALRLLREKRILALKQTEGSHGAGFYKLEYRDGKYLVNGKEKSEKELLSFLGSLKRYYTISEYIIMHEDLRRIYSSVACTVRMMVINRTGKDPVIENAYFRIGTKSTGFTDNIGSGGVFAYADVESGRFHDAEVIRQHIITPCPEHPDTHVPIDGVFPHWQEVCETVTKMCRYLKPIEYMGFDVVITDGGFKILEINTHQDLHRYPTYNENVHAYFMDKLELKRQGVKLA